MARVAVVIAALGFAAPASAHWAPNIPHHNARHAANLVWCGRSNVRCVSSDEAWRVASCETGRTFNLYARNANPPSGDAGDYLGLWQLGDYARSRFGPFRWNPWAQARAAFRYYYYTLLRTGYGWYPWECRP